MFACALCLASSLFAQNWKKVHRSDEAKWAKTTGLDPAVIHKLWRDASQTPNEKDDDSRIANIDLDGLAERHDVLLVTYAGEKNCLTLTVFRQIQNSSSRRFGRLMDYRTRPASAMRPSAPPSPRL